MIIADTVPLAPLLILVIGVAVVIGMITVLKINAFLALITAAIVVSLLAPGEPADKISRVASAFGGTAGGIGIVIALAAVIGKCMMDSGAADRIVRFFLGLLGEKRGGTALMSSGFVLSIPVFFDTVFYLLVPLARSMYRRTGGHYLKYIMAIAAGGAITHTLVPPTPGPLVMADTLGVDLGVMMIVGAAVALPAAIVGLLYCGWADRRMNIPMRPLAGVVEAEPLADDELPSLGWSLAPVVLPILLITTSSGLGTYANAERAAKLQTGDITDWTQMATTLRDASNAPAGRVVEFLPENAKAAIEAGEIASDDQQALLEGLNRVLVQRGFYDYKTFVGVELPPAARDLLKKDLGRMPVAQVERLNRLLLEASFPELVEKHFWETPRRRAANYGELFGNANFALLLSAAVAMGVLVRRRKLSWIELAASVETALMSGGVIILITAAGGAFGAMLGKAEIGPAIQTMFASETSSTAGGLALLVIAFALASLLKFAQGSSTVAMITGASMLAAMVSPESLPFHPAYLATAVGSGSLVGSWMNDSGFWIFAKMGGLTEVESLKTWTPLLVVLGVTAFVVTLLLAVTVPLV